MKRKTRKTIKRSIEKNYVVVSSRSYGKSLKGIKIYYEGKRPKELRNDGSITFGKHILELFVSIFSRFRWTITHKTDLIEKKWNVTRVCTSRGLLSRMRKEEWDRRRDIKNDIVRKYFAKTFPAHFTAPPTAVYSPGTLAGIIDATIVEKLSSIDKDALKAFIPAFIASESIGTVRLINAESEIKSLRQLTRNFEDALQRNHGESWWQTYIKANILLMQQGYIKALSKINIATGQTKFPDFSLITHDNYLDILEIKKPDTPLLKEDRGRGNFYWHSELSQAIIQTENYIALVSNHSDNLRTYLMDHHKLDTKALRPRGIILAGDARKLTNQKQKDDFRLLSHGMKNITILTYDELMARLKNYIVVLESFKRSTSTAKG